MSHILIVEDENTMRAGLKDNLEFEGFTVDEAADGAEGLHKILNDQYDLILLDVMMPHMSGFDVCKKAREQQVKTPIIMLTAKGEEIDKVLGLELGADDYICKPFSLRELLARVKAVLRRSENTAAPVNSAIKIGNAEVDFSVFNFYSNGEMVPTTHKEFEILKYLWQHQGETVSRESLLNDVWGYDDYPTTRTVDNFILRLRQKIEPDPSHPRHILTVHGIGYKLIP